MTDEERRRARHVACRAIEIMSCEIIGAPSCAVRRAGATAIAVVFSAAHLVSIAPQCRPTGPLTRLPELNEASGLAASQAVAGRLWAHNDSGQPIVFALDTRGQVTSRVRVTGAAVVDWEAIGVGPCPAGSCLYIGDIGDNTAARRSISVYRTPEPSVGAEVATVSDVFHATYPDGAHDAETLLVTPSGELFVVTKDSPGGGALYRFPRELRPGAMHRLELVGSARPGRASRNDRITDGSVSPDGAWVALRTGQRLDFYATAELLNGNWRVVRTVDVTAIGEPQGEGVAIGTDQSVFLAGEGGRKSGGGTFAHLACTSDQNAFSR
jgi:hypothetical protein